VSNSSFSSKAQQREEEEDQEQRGQRLGGMTTNTLPSLRSRMKHFAKIVHPDILGQHFPRRANVMHELEDKERKYVLENNQNALAELNAVLDSITKEKKFPKTGVKVIAIFKLFSIFSVSRRRFSLSRSLSLSSRRMFVPPYASA